MPDGVAGAGGKLHYYDASEDMSGDDGMMSAAEMVVREDAVRPTISESWLWS